jgi:hypothetical protein
MSAAPTAQSTGKQDEITLKSATEFGNTLQKPGTYYVEHEMNGGRHVFTFQQVGDPAHRSIAMKA